jgi:flagellar hook-basal body complex protein FliE
MKVNLAGAAAAYAGAARKAMGPGLEPRQTGGADFAGAMREAAQSTIATLKQAEAVSLQATVGKADIGQVVTAVSNAEVTLQAAVAVRDRVIQAYLDIIRMPI